MSGETDAVRAEIQAIVAPLREKAAQLEELIEDRMIELEELRSTLKDVNKMLDRADPSRARVNKKQAPKTTVVGRVAPDTVTAVEKRLHNKRTEVNGDGGFTTTSLRRDHGFDDVSQSTLAKVIAVLHERDLLRLDHRGRGGAHYFKVVA